MQLTFPKANVSCATEAARHTRTSASISRVVCGMVMAEALEERESFLETLAQRGRHAVPVRLEDQLGLVPLLLQVFLQVR